MFPKHNPYVHYLLAAAIVLLVFGVLSTVLDSSNEEQQQTESTITGQVTETEGVQLDDSFTGDTDDADFTGLAVFPSWSTLEPATFPTVIDGEAPRSWFADGSFTVEVRTTDALLAQGNAIAQESESMAESDVMPFYAELTAVDDVPEYVGTAALVLTKQGGGARFTTQITVDTTQ